jgi:mono/diheme cytochrome c family protein
MRLSERWPFSVFKHELNPSQFFYILNKSPLKEMERQLRKFLVGFAVGLLVMPAFIFFYLRSGRAPVATSEPPMPFERSLARAAIHARIAKEMPATVPITPDETNLIAGARIYKQHCSFCHGVPDQPATASSKGMFPKAPQLFVRKVTDDPAGEIFWKVANGIRLSGMPGYGAVLTTDQIWQVSLFLVQADKLPPGAQMVLKQ